MRRGAPLGHGTASKDNPSLFAGEPRSLVHSLAGRAVDQRADEYPLPRRLDIRSGSRRFAIPRS